MADMKRFFGACLLAVTLLLPAPARADEAGARRAFETATHDEPSLVAFLRRMPKGGDLHLHLTGAIDSEFLLDQAIQQNLFFDPNTRKFERTDGPGRIAAARLPSDEKALRLFLDAASMRPIQPGQIAHDHFFDAFAFIKTVTDGLPKEVALAAVMRDAEAQNVQYLEVMLSPPAGHVLRTLAPKKLDDMDAALKALGPAIDAYVKQARADLDAMTARLPRSKVNVRYIVEVSRESSDGVFFALVAAAMRLMQVDPRVVSVNPVAPEDAIPARRNFAAQMRAFDFLWRHFGHPNLTMHAGELTPRFSSLDPMRTHIRDSIEIGHARRIGHGVAIGWDDHVDELLAEMRRDHVTVEICLSSNDLILGVRGEAHPIHLYHRAGVPIAISTDDAGISRSNLTMEYVRMVTTLHPRYDEVKDIVRNAIEYAFLRGDSLYQNHDYRSLRPGFEGVRGAQWTPDDGARKQLEASEKLRQQVQLERAFVEFERQYP